MLIKRVCRMNDNVLRIECAPENPSNLLPTFAVKHPERFKKVRMQKRGKTEVFKNKYLSITLEQDGKMFSAQNLEIRWTKDVKTYTWHPGEKDHENLGGHFFSLDLCQEPLTADGVIPFDPMKGLDAYSYHPAKPINIILREIKNKLGRHSDSKEWLIEWNNLLAGRDPEIIDEWPSELSSMLKKIRRYPPGLLSKSGMSILLDNSFLWDSAEEWIYKNQGQQQTLYLFYYGTDFKKAVSLMAQVFGTIPEVPEWVMGIWFSCYRKMGEAAFKRIKEDFDKYNLPLDVLVVDTDWHRYCWHGFDWNRRLFPDPERFARWLRAHDLHASFNVHPQYIPKNDSRLKEFIERSGATETYLDEQTSPHPFFNDCLPVDLYDKKQAMAYFDVFHKPIERQGCDLWWVDGVLRDSDGNESTTWLNELYFRFTNQSPRKDTSIVLSRGYGLGAHRSTINFTADTLSQWKVLDQEVVMTHKAANCLFAYVSHDVGGFLSGSPEWKHNKPPDDLFIRWTQFGCLSPIMRFHSDHGIREPWRFKKTTTRIIRNFLQFRKCLMPYIMQIVKTAHEKGLALCRPLYFEFPEYDESYTFERQYMFGDAMLAAFVTSPESTVTTWIPPGTWYHCFIERKVVGPAVIEEEVPLEYVPLYVREGHKVPFKKVADLRKRRSKKQYTYSPSTAPLCSMMGIKI